MENINRQHCLQAFSREVDAGIDEGDYKRAIYLKVTHLYGIGNSVEDIAKALSLSSWQVNEMINTILDRNGF